MHQVDRHELSFPLQLHHRLHGIHSVHGGQLAAKSFMLSSHATSGSVTSTDATPDRTQAKQLLDLPLVSRMG